MNVVFYQYYYYYFFLRIPTILFALRKNTNKAKKSRHSKFAMHPTHRAPSQFIDLRQGLFRCANTNRCDVTRTDATLRGGEVCQCKYVLFRTETHAVGLRKIECIRGRKILAEWNSISRLKYNFYTLETVLSGMGKYVRPTYRYYNNNIEEVELAESCLEKHMDFIGFIRSQVVQEGLNLFFS